MNLNIESRSRRFPRAYLSRTKAKMKEEEIDSPPDYSNNSRRLFTSLPDWICSYSSTQSGMFTPLMSACNDNKSSKQNRLKHKMMRSFFSLSLASVNNNDDQGYDNLLLLERSFFFLFIDEIRCFEQMLVQATSSSSGIQNELDYSYHSSIYIICERREEEYYASDR